MVRSWLLTSKTWTMPSKGPAKRCRTPRRPPRRLRRRRRGESREAARGRQDGPPRWRTDFSSDVHAARLPGAPAAIRGGVLPLRRPGPHHSSARRRRSRAHVRRAAHCAAGCTRGGGRHFARPALPSPAASRAARDLPQLFARSRHPPPGPARAPGATPALAGWSARNFSSPGAAFRSAEPALLLGAPPPAAAWLERAGVADASWLLRPWAR